MAKNLRQDDSQLPVEKYIRLVDVTEPMDMLPAWQPEIIEIQNNKVLSKKKVGTRDVWVMAFAMAQELIDPRNEQ